MLSHYRINKGCHVDEIDNRENYEINYNGFKSARQFALDHCGETTGSNNYLVALSSIGYVESIWQR